MGDIKVHLTTKLYIVQDDLVVTKVWLGPSN